MIVLMNRKYQNAFLEYMVKQILWEIGYTSNALRGPSFGLIQYHVQKEACLLYYFRIPEHEFFPQFYKLILRLCVQTDCCIAIYSTVFVSKGLPQYTLQRFRYFRTTTLAYQREVTILMKEVIRKRFWYTVGFIVSRGPDQNAKNFHISQAIFDLVYPFYVLVK